MPTHLEGKVKLRNFDPAPDSFLRYEYLAELTPAVYSPAVFVLLLLRPIKNAYIARTSTYIVPLLYAARPPDGVKTVWHRRTQPVSLDPFLTGGNC